MTRYFASRAAAGCVALSIGLTLVAAPAQAEVAPCYPAVGCNPVVTVEPGVLFPFFVTIDNLVPGTTATATWFAGGQGRSASATVGANGVARIPLDLIDTGVTTTVTVTGTTTGPNGNPVSVVRTTFVSLPSPPCFPASSCDPGVSVNPGTTTGTGYSITIDDLIPGTTVTVTWVADGKTQTATAVVGPDGRATVPLSVLDVGVTTQFTITGFTANASGQAVPVTRTGSVTTSPSPTPTPPSPTPTTPSPTPTVTPTPPPPAPSLFARATAVSRFSQLRTFISGDPAAAARLATLSVCRGPFKFRIQKQKITTIPNGSDEPTIRVTWTTLSRKYTTNKRSGLWYYRTVNLKKGTYRSLVYGKCGLLGTTTNQVTLKR